MVAKKKGTGGNLTRSQVVTVRLDPKLKFAAELAARKQRRTISSFIEWAVEQAIEKVPVTSGGIEAPEKSVYDILETVWDVEESDRLVKLAIHFPQLLTFEEEKIWKLICEYSFFWKDKRKPPQSSNNLESLVNLKAVLESWDTLNEALSDRLAEVRLDERDRQLGRKI